CKRDNRSVRNLIALLCSTACFAADAPTLSEAQAFIDRAQAKLLEVGVRASRADWVKSTFITGDTEILAAHADEEQIAATMQLAKESTRFNSVKMPEAMAREFKLLRLGLTLAAPSNPGESKELTEIAARMEGMYGQGKYCPSAGKCLDLEELST